MSDPLAEIIGMLMPRLPDTKIVHAAGSWRVERSEVGKAYYCMLLAGTTVLDVEGAERVTLNAGDFVLVPAAANYAMSSLDAPLSTPLRDAPPRGEDGIVRIGPPDGEAAVQMVIGYCSLGSPDAELLVSLLPEMVVVREAARLEALSRMIADEARSDRPGRDVVLEHLIQVMLIEALRSSPETNASPGLLKGLADERLGPALRAIHTVPARAWTVADMSRIAGLSRSAYFARFQKNVGMPPMDYLLGWRMAIAKDHLRKGVKTIAQIASEVGYGSASAFSIAFSRQVGVPPGQFGRQSVGLPAQPARHASTG
ncbi:MAG: AraC family transcriptional regulator [Rhodobacteraceae bacterium]|nr:AraC family transcriptional regulator [Paracoccaceae bacterium]